VPSKKFLRDALERVGWAALYAAIAMGITIASDLPYQWAPVLTVALNALKVWVAKYVGNPDTAKFDKE